MGNNKSGALVISILTEMELPILLNASRRRSVTLESFVAPPRLRNTVYRCREFPRGIYIDKLGKLRPEHEASGSYHDFRQHGEDEEDEGSQISGVSDPSRHPDEAEADSEYDDDKHGDLEDTASEDADEEQDEDSEEEESVYDASDSDTPDEDASSEAEELPNRPLKRRKTLKLSREERLQELKEAELQAHHMLAQQQRQRRGREQRERIMAWLEEQTESWSRTKTEKHKLVRFRSQLWNDPPQYKFYFVPPAGADAGQFTTGWQLNTDALTLTCECGHTVSTATEALFHHGLPTTESCRLPETEPLHDLEDLFDPQ